MSTSPEIQRIAFALVESVSKIGMSKAQANKENFTGIRSLGTQHKYQDHIEAFLDYLKELGQSFRGPHLVVDMQQHLYALADDPQKQEYLNSARQALQCVFNVELTPVTSEVPTILRARAYTDSQVQQIIDIQSERHAFSTQLAYESNLRAHELITISLANEMERSPERNWRTDLFAHTNDVVIYTVKGKGGLQHHVAVPAVLAERLEKYRIPDGVNAIYRDRDIDYFPKYDISCGQAFSQAFTTASQKALGFSHGAHGLRHTYAQKRFMTLKANGLDTQTAMLILSQELGHFRPDIVLAYLR